MAIDFRDVRGKLPRNMTISASCKTDNILRIKVRKVPEAEILAAFERAINRASARIAVDLKIALDDAIRSPVWTTLQGTADIYDTGELMQSGSVTVRRDGVTIAYDAPYAAIVHYGGYVSPFGTAASKIYLPPRPWVESVLNGGGPVEAFDFAKYYQQEIEAEFR